MLPAPNRLFLDGILQFQAGNRDSSNKQKAFGAAFNLHFSRLLNKEKNNHGALSVLFLVIRTSVRGIETQL
jgi:hypothetical protein